VIQRARFRQRFVSTSKMPAKNGAYNQAFMVMTLAPWDDTHAQTQEIMASQPTDLAGAIRSIFSRCRPQPRHRGAKRPLQFALVGNARKGAGRFRG